MAQYIQIISKLKPKNLAQFKLLDLSDVSVNYDTNNNNILYAAGENFSVSGINWDITGAGTCKISGDLYVTGNLYQASDRALKTNIIPIKNALNKISLLQGVSFNWLQTNEPDYGLIAQQLQKVIPEAVSKQNSTGLRRVAYNKLIPFLLEAIKQLNMKVERLQKQRSIKDRIKSFLRLKQETNM